VRTNIEIDDQLMQQAMRSTGARTKKAVVEAGLRPLVKTHAQTGIRQLRGKVKWHGDLNESRQGRIRRQVFTSLS
jgi:Arc/MetJ family transcription regulator